MPIARKIDKDTLKDFSSQMKTNFTKTTTVVEEEPPVLRQAQQPQTVAVPEPVEGATAEMSEGIFSNSASQS